jgi:hypothetical protein
MYGPGHDRRCSQAIPPVREIPLHRDAVRRHVYQKLARQVELSLVQVSIRQKMIEALLQSVGIRHSLCISQQQLLPAEVAFNLHIFPSSHQRHLPAR